MNELIAPLLFAAIFSAGDGLQQRGVDKAKADRRAGPAAEAQASVYPARYRSVDASKELQRGERLPARYQAHQHVVEDWRALRLTQPPRGHQWVDAGGRYALVAIATGRVAKVVMVR
jgi:Ni/Co efflux regulator RcnB